MLWKPIVITIGILVVKEAGVYALRFAVGKFLTERLRSKLNVVKRDFGEAQEDIQNGVDPTNPGARKRKSATRAAGSRKTTKTKGGDAYDAEVGGRCVGANA